MKLFEAGEVLLAEGRVSLVMTLFGEGEVLPEGGGASLVMKVLGGVAIQGLIQEEAGATRRMSGGRRVE